MAAQRTGLYLLITNSLAMVEAGPGFPNTGSRVMEQTSHAASPGSPEDTQRDTSAPRLKNLAKTAKLRQKAANARVKANRLAERSGRLTKKAVDWESYADELDGIRRIGSKTQ